MLLRRLLAFRGHHTLTAALSSSSYRLCGGCGANAREENARLSSAVNVEDFTLNGEIVKKDVEALERWNNLARRMDALRVGNQYESLLAAVGEGITMLKEMGAMNAPIQCEVRLLLEGARAHYSLKQYDSALENARRAKDLLMADPEEVRDAALIALANQLIGYVHLECGRLEESHRVFTEVLHWIDVDARTAPPMQAIEAANNRRCIITGLAMYHQCVADKQCAEGGDGREMYGKAIELHLEALNAHIDENDSPLVKLSLLKVMLCFDGVHDGGQAVDTAEKLLRWCTRQKDEEGITEANQWLTKMSAKYRAKGD